MKLTIDIDETTFRVYVGGSQIGLIKKITLDAGTDGDPQIKIAFPPDNALSDNLKKVVKGYKESLHMVPCVAVIP